MKRIELAYKALQIGLSLLLLFISTLSLAGFFSSADQVCELLSHWRLLWTIALFALSLALLLCFSETNPLWMRKLAAGLKDYQYQAAAEKQSDGLAIFSRIVLTKVETKYSKAAHRPRLYVHLKVAGHPLVLEFAHPLLPVIPYLRNEELSEIAEDAKSAKEPFILAGDLNCTPWSYFFSKLLTDGRLHDTEQGHGPQPSWNSMWLLPLLPIDHCLTSAQFRTTFRRTGHHIGSDHLPVLVELSL